MSRQVRISFLLQAAIELRAFLTFANLKKGKIKSLPSPTPARNIFTLSELLLGNNKHPIEEWGGKWIVSFSEEKSFNNFFPPIVATMLQVSIRM